MCAYQAVPDSLASDRSLKGRIRLFLKMIDFHESVFSLPFSLAAVAMAIAVRGRGLELREIFWIIIALVSGRSIAMAFNRIIDLEYDRRNPRTAGAILPRGLLSKAEVWLFTAVFVVLFLVAAGQLSPICLKLAPLALLWITLYSYAKRFTWLVHLWLGISLGIAPYAAWIALVPESLALSPIPVLLGLAVASWVTGFDIIFALQDREADAQEGLLSIPVRFGVARSLAISRFLHAQTMVALIVIGFLLGGRLAASTGGLPVLWPFYWLGLTAVGGLLTYEHVIISPQDLSRLNTAYFRINGLVSLAYFVFTLLALAF